jgi:hypothetical protein
MRNQGVLTLTLNAHLLADFPPFCVNFFVIRKYDCKKIALPSKKSAQNLDISDSVNTP